MIPSVSKSKLILLWEFYISKVDLCGARAEKLDTFPMALRLVA